MFAGTFSQDAYLDLVTTPSPFDNFIETDWENNANETDRNANENLAGDGSKCILFQFMVKTVGIGSLFTFGLVGNSLSFIVLFKQRATSASILILLAFSTIDSLFIAVNFMLKSVPAFVDYSGLLTGFNYYHPYFFVYLRPFIPVLSTMTSYTTLLMAIHRFVAVCKPFKLKTIASVRQTKFQLAFVILFAFIFNLPYFFLYSLHIVRSPVTNEPTIVMRGSNLRANFYFYLIYVVIGHYVVISICPFITLLIITIKLIRGLRRAERQRKKMSTSVDPHKTQADEITPALIGIVIVYFICHTPVFIRRFLVIIIQPKYKRGCDSFYVYAEEIEAFLTVLSSSVNFVIYIITSKSFRETLSGMFKAPNAFQHKNRTTDTLPSTSKTDVGHAKKQNA